MNDVWNPESLVGVQLGSCVLERPLGIGGMGAVYLARQLRPRRHVAVKVLRPHLAADPAAWRVFLTRFQREADAAAALDHANIVPIFEFGEDGERAYLVMPYLGERSLATELTRIGAMPLETVVAHVAQAAAALDYAHARGIVHRDVKPSNLLFHPDGRLLLADFGIARARDLADPVAAASRAAGDLPADATLTQVGMAMGTPEYMAPEQILGEPVSAATDVYALGIVAYAMLSGQTPYRGGQTAQVIERHLREPPPPLRLLHPEIPPRLEETIFWALAKDARERPQSAGAFARELAAGSQSRRFAALLARIAPFREPGTTSPLARAFGARPPLAAEVTPYVTPVAAQLGRAAPVVESAATAATVLRATWSEETLYEPVAPAGPQGPQGAPPQWPVPGGSPPPRRPRLPAGCLATIAVALVTGLLAFGLVFAGNGLLMRLTGTGIAGARTPTPPAATATTMPTATPNPTATPQPTATPVPRFGSSWLSVSPQRLDLTCSSNGSKQTFIVSNSGPSRVDWTAVLPGMAGISVHPTSGALDSGESTRVTVTNTSVVVGRQGQLHIAPADGDAGAGATVTYTTQGCAP